MLNYIHRPVKRKKTNMETLCKWIGGYHDDRTDKGSKNRLLWISPWGMQHIV